MTTRPTQSTQLPGLRVLHSPHNLSFPVIFLISAENYSRFQPDLRKSLTVSGWRWLARWFRIIGCYCSAQLPQCIPSSRSSQWYQESVPRNINSICCCQWMQWTRVSSLSRYQWMCCQSCRCCSQMTGCCCWPGLSRTQCGNTAPSNFSALCFLWTLRI